MRALAARNVLAVAAVVFAVSTVRADDFAQIEKAKNSISEAERWVSIACFDKTEQALVAAEKELKGVDETGKAEHVAKIKELRDKITEMQRFWDRDKEIWRKSIERQISSDESVAERSRGAAECFEKSDAQLADSWIKTHLDAKVLEDLQKKQAWSKKKTLQQGMADEAERAKGQIGRLMGGPESCVESAKTSSDEPNLSYIKKQFADQTKEIEAVIAEHQNALGAEQVAEYRKHLADLKAEFPKNLGLGQIHDLERLVKLIEDGVTGVTNTYTDNIERWYKEANERAAKCPTSEPRTKELTTKLADLRKTFDKQQAQGAHDELVKPAIDYWAYCKENYMKDAEGWEQETRPNTLQFYTHNSPAKIGCEKTEELLSNVVQRYLEDDRVKKAIAKYPNDPDLKKIYDEATGLRDKASAKVLEFFGSLLNEAEKLPEGSERKDFTGHFYNLKNEINRHCKGAPGTDKLIARIDALEKKWVGDNAAADAAKKAQDEKVCKSVQEAWPELAKGWLGKVKKLDATAALGDINAWKGTVVHFSGGSRGVNMNRAGWDWFGDYAFVSEVDGVPVCGDLDAGVLEAVNEVVKQTGIDEDNCEECIGIVDGTCKITQRVKIFDQYVKGEIVNGVRIRIVGWRACTVCAVAGEGTNLSKLKEYKEVSVKEAGVSGSGGGAHHGGGSSSSGGFGHMIHRLIAWGMCFLLAIAGAFTAAHGAAKFVPQLQENLAKLGSKLGYIGIGFAVVAALWFVAALAFWVIEGHGGSLPSVALFFAGAFVALDLLREKGTLKPETASMIQPVGILLGLGCFAAAFVHFLFWDWTLL